MKYLRNHTFCFAYTFIRSWRGSGAVRPMESGTKSSLGRSGVEMGGTEGYKTFENK